MTQSGMFLKTIQVFDLSILHNHSSTQHISYRLESLGSFKAAMPSEVSIFFLSNLTIPSMSN
uniref:Uncharacterized protein n=1 Tax=Arundo donax TaxID=35708 RepID=A0A0A9EHD4_ARUDO